MVDRQIAVERKLRRLPRGSGGGESPGPWYDLESHLSAGAPGPQIFIQSEGFGIRRWTAPDGAESAEFRGAIYYNTDDDTFGGILDTLLPVEFRPTGLRDVFASIDGDNTPTDFFPIEGGFSYNITAGGAIVVDPARVVVNLGVTPPVLQHAGLANNFGYPRDTTVTIWNGVWYPITAL